MPGPKVVHLKANGHGDEAQSDGEEAHDDVEDLGWTSFDEHADLGREESHHSGGEADQDKGERDHAWKQEMGQQEDVIQPKTGILCFVLALLASNGDGFPADYSKSQNQIE